MEDRVNSRQLFFISELGSLLKNSPSNKFANSLFKKLYPCCRRHGCLSSSTETFRVGYFKGSVT